MFDIESEENKIKLCEHFVGIPFEGDTLNKAEVEEYLNEYFSDALDSYREYLNSYAESLSTQ